MVDGKPVLISVGQAAKALSLSERTVWRMIERREIESVKLNGSRRVTAASVEARIAEALEAAREEA